ncbi:F-box/kelch-repeat protein At3g23880-like [Rhododendron vialii]|uniref:F-box/kelch-repeat protein At3g23880-like n=1 Tax=Rhododendron vialii TaxID=182163 RepID=UPI00265ECD81|nr:F-box/kelch-repeat protein At3g23880-like [Rhododendron vialii]
MGSSSSSQSTNQMEEDLLPNIPPKITGTEEDSQQILLPNLPLEIIVEEILSRLPVKSLLRSRCVCKSWRSLISDPNFARIHLRRASSSNISNDCTHHRLLISHGVRSHSLYSAFHEHSDAAVRLDYPGCDPRGLGDGVRILGSCDGLVCIETARTLFLWNPSTRKSKRLPSVRLPPDHLAAYGFGYDASIDDYKVVGFLSNVHIDIGFHFEVEVYTMRTMRTDSWRRIGDFPHGHHPYRTYRHCSGVFVNGALHWDWRRKTNGIIVSLDLATETYGEVLKPEYRVGLSHEIMCAVNGCLCVIHDYRTCADVWVMKEYGVRESWTKLAAVPYMASASNLKSTTLVCVLRNGEVLLHMLNRKHLVRYNPKDGTISYPPIFFNLEYSGVHSYIESLVSVDMDADHGVPWQHQY